MALVKVERKIQSIVDRSLHKATSKMGKTMSAKNGMGGKSQRMLLNNSIPHTSYKVSGDQQGMTVTGVEVVNQINVTKAPARTIVGLNPVASPLFPRLSGLASQFQQYRFERVSLRYHPACAATTSGAIGLCVFPQYAASVTEVPLFMPELGSFQYSAVGTVAGMLQTPDWRVKDPEYFFIGDASNVLNVSDPLKVFQGSLGFVTRDADTADDGKLAGYISIQYTVRFISWRPTRDAFYLAGSAEAPQSIVNNATFSLDTILNKVGSWGLEKIGSIVTSVTPSAKVLGDLALNLPYISSIVGLLTEAESSEQDVKSDHFQMVPPPLKRQTNKLQSSTEIVTVYYNPLFVDSALVSASEVSSQLPQAPGDFTLKLVVAQEGNSLPAQIIASKSYAAGTAALPIDFSVPFTLDTVSGFTEGGDLAVFWQAAMPGGETRLLTNMRTSLCAITSNLPAP